tara:strand:+ start:516 stop:914 length:399 start_codon:yes stop_codon:yes gene_type:complete
MNLADAQEILHQLGVPRFEKDPIFSQLPNNLIMKIIREADGGRNAHKEKFAGVVKIIQHCGDEADRAAREDCRCWTPEHGWVPSTYSDSDESDSEDEGSDYYWDVWQEWFYEGLVHTAMTVASQQGENHICG